MRRLLVWVSLAACFAVVASSAVLAEDPGFRDVPADAPQREAIRWAYENGITSGKSATRFGYGDSLTRAEAITFLLRYHERILKREATGLFPSPFSDVEKGAWYETPVRWAYTYGITKGMGRGRFGVNETLTYAQTITFFHRMLFGQTNSDPWWEAPVAWAVEEGLWETGYVLSERIPRENFVLMMWKTQNQDAVSGRVRVASSGFSYNEKIDFATIKTPPGFSPALTFSCDGVTIDGYKFTGEHLRTGVASDGTVLEEPIANTLVTYFSSDGYRLRQYNNEDDRDYRSRIRRLYLPAFYATVGNDEYSRASIPHDTFFNSSIRQLLTSSPTLSVKLYNLPEHRTGIEAHFIAEYIFDVAAHKNDILTLADGC